MDGYLVNDKLLPNDHAVSVTHMMPSFYKPRCSNWDFTARFCNPVGDSGYICFLCVVCGKKATKSACWVSAGGSGHSTVGANTGTNLGGCSSGSRAGNLLMARLVVWYLTDLTAPVFGQDTERLVALRWVHQGMNVCECYKFIEACFCH